MVQPERLFVILEKYSMSIKLLSIQLQAMRSYGLNYRFPPEFRVAVSIMEKVSKIQNSETISTTIFSRKPEISRTL